MPEMSRRKAVVPEAIRREGEDGFRETNAETGDSGARRKIRETKEKPPSRLSLYQEAANDYVQVGQIIDRLDAVHADSNIAHAKERIRSLERVIKDDEAELAAKEEAFRKIWFFQKPFSSLPAEMERIQRDIASHKESLARERENVTGSEEAKAKTKNPETIKRVTKMREKYHVLGREKDDRKKAIEDSGRR